MASIPATILIRRGLDADVTTYAAGSKNNGEPMWATDTEKLYIVQDNKAVEISGGGGSGTVEVVTWGGLSGDGSAGDPLRIDVANMISNPGPTDVLKLPLVGPTGADIEYCTIGEMFNSATSGDVTYSTSAVATVTGLRSVTVSATAPTTGQVLTYNGTQWAPAAPNAINLATDSGLSGNGSSGDPLTVDIPSLTSTAWIDVATDWLLLSQYDSKTGTHINRKVRPHEIYSDITGDVEFSVGTSPAAIVTGLRTVAISETAPSTAGQLLTYDGTQWAPAAPAKVNLASGVTGTLPVANGGSGATTLTGYVKGNGTSAMTAAATIPNTDITGLGAMATVGSVTLSGDVTGTGTSAITATIANDAVTFAKMQNVATDTLLGRSTAGTGDVETITCTAFARSILDDATALAARTTLGLGAIAIESAFPGATGGVANLSVSNFDTTTSWADLSGMTTTSLAAGTYEIEVNIRWNINYVTSGYILARLTTTGGTVVQESGSDAVKFLCNSNQAGVSLQGTTSLRWTVSPGSSTAYKIQVQSTTAHGGSTTARISDSTIGRTSLYWRRVA